MAAPFILTARDCTILRMVHAYGGCTTDQVARRIFPGLRSTRACHRRLARLTADGYLRSRRLPSMTGQGSGRAFYTLTPRGRSAVAREEMVTTTELGRMRAASPRFIEHHLAIGDTRIALELAAERSGMFGVTDWLSDRHITLTVNAGSELITLVPDSGFRLWWCGRLVAPFFLEQDTGTLTNRGRMKRRLEGYVRHLTSTNAVLLLVTTTTARVDALLALVQSVAAVGPVGAERIWLARQEDIQRSDAIFGPIWRQAAQPRPFTIAEAIQGAQEAPAA